MKKIAFLAIISLLLSSCVKDLPLGTLSCPQVLEVSPSAASFGEIVTISVANLVALKEREVSETYAVFIAGTPVPDSHLESFDLQGGVIKIRIPKTARSGLLSVNFSGSTGFAAECTSAETAMPFEYLPRYSSFGTVISNNSCTDLCQPSGIDVDRDGRLYVAEHNNNLILQVDPVSGNVLATLGDKNAPGCHSNLTLGRLSTFSQPTALAVDRDRGELFVAGIGSCMVRKISLSGNFSTAAIAGTCGNCSGRDAGELFRAPHGLDVLPDGTVLVADFTDHLITSLTPVNVETNRYDMGIFAGNQIMGNCTALDGTLEEVVFCQLKDLAVDLSEEDPVLYVLEFNSSGLRVIRDGIVKTVQLASSDGAALQNPSSITSDHRGNLYIADQTRREVYRVDLFTGRLYRVSDITSLSSPTGIAYDPRSTMLYVSDGGRGNIVRLKVE